MKGFYQAVVFLVLLSSLTGCRADRVRDGLEDPEGPRYLELVERPGGGWNAVSVSPFDGSRDTLIIDRPLGNLIVMSTSHYGFLDALDALDHITGVSGLDFIYTTPDSSSLAVRHSGSDASLREVPVATSTVVDVGYDAAPDYEKIVALKPDVVLTYAVSGAKSPFVTKLTQLGIKVFIVNEHLESHPLARASYIRLFGALTGKMAEADSILADVKADYNALRDEVRELQAPERKVLLNIPYNDQWFVPSRDSYLTSLVHDAGGEVLGCEEGRAASSVMPVEKAYALSKDADCWLNVGWCTTLPQLLDVNPVFGDMVANIRDNALKLGYGSYPVIWNDNKRVNRKGGNDIWQSGVARPDVLLRDLIKVLHPDRQGEALETTYYRPII